MSDAPLPLTLDAALALPAGRDLDALVAAHIMGLRVEWGTSYDGNPQPFCRQLRGQYDEAGWLPQYSTDVADAWLVVEHFSPADNRAPILELKQVWGGPLDRHPHYTCNLGGGWASGETAPFAICRAAVLAAMGE